MSKISEFLINNGWAVVTSVVIVIGGLAVSYYRIGALAADMSSYDKSISDLKVTIDDIKEKQIETRTELRILTQNLREERIEDLAFQREIREAISR